MLPTRGHLLAVVVHKGHQSTLLHRFGDAVSYLSGGYPQGLGPEVRGSELHDVALVEQSGVGHGGLGGEPAQRLLLLAHHLTTRAKNRRQGRGRGGRGAHTCRNMTLRQQKTQRGAGGGEGGGHMPKRDVARTKNTMSFEGFSRHCREAAAAEIDTMAKSLEPKRLAGSCIGLLVHRICVCPDWAEPGGQVLKR